MLVQQTDRAGDAEGLAHGRAVSNCVDLVCTAGAERLKKPSVWPAPLSLSSDPTSVPGLGLEVSACPGLEVGHFQVVFVALGDQFGAVAEEPRAYSLCPVHWEALAVSPNCQLLVLSWAKLKPLLIL